MLGGRIGAFEIVRHAATGAMSDVYEGRDTRDGRPVAVKVLHREWCIDPTLVARFSNEASALAAVRNPRVVEVLDHGRLPDNTPFMVLEWLPATLEQALSRGGPLSPPIAARVGACLAVALATLHERGVVHRDLKPANVLLSSEDLGTADIKLADLGTAKLDHVRLAEKATAADSTLLPVSTGGDDLLGTCEYMAPEQWMRSKSIGPEADVYALGIVLFRMLTGRLPFPAEAPQELMYHHLFTPPPLESLDAVVASDVVATLARMLDKHLVPRPTMEHVACCLGRHAPGAIGGWTV